MTAGVDTTTSSSSHDDHFSGLVVTVTTGKGNPLGDAVKANSSISAANKTKDPLAAELYSIAAGMQTATTVNSVINAAAKSQWNTFGNTEISATYTTSDTHTTKSSYAEKASGTNAVTAGGTASLVATGGDLTLQGVNVKGKDVDLEASNDVNLLSLALNSNSENSSTSKSNSIGAKVDFGPNSSFDGFGDVSVGVTVSANSNNSQSQTVDQTHAQTTVTGSNSVTIVSGRDTNLKGAEVSGKTIDVTVGRDLTIVSDQDTETQTASQSSKSSSVSVGYDFGKQVPNASLSLSASNGTASGDYKSVTKQSGLFAGSGGFDVNVAGVTTLTGAAIASTADASKNSLKTGALVTSDLQNSSNWQAKSTGYSINLNSNSLGKDALTGGIQPSLSQSASGSSSGTAVASIAPGSITIVDAATQQMLTGMTPEQAIAAVNRAASAQNKAADKLPGLSQDLKNQADVTKAFASASSATASAVSAIANDIVTFETNKIKEIQNDPSLTDAERNQQIDAANEMIKAWKIDDQGQNGQALILVQGLAQGVLGGIVGGNAAGIETGTSVIASNVIAGQVQKTWMLASMSIPKDIPTRPYPIS